MTPVYKFFIRLVVSIIAAYFIATMYFDQIGLERVVFLAAIMLFVAYVFEAVRKTKK